MNDERSRTGLLWAWSLFIAALLAIHAASAAAETQPGSELRPLEVQSYRDDLGVSAETAEKNLLLQRSGAGAVDELKAVQGGDYAGVWFDNEGGEFVVPVMQGAEGEALQKALSDAGIATSTRLEPATYSWFELEATQEQLDLELLDQLKEGLIQTSLDPRANAVVVGVASRATKPQQAEIEGAASKFGTRVEVRSLEAENLEAKNTSCQFEFKRCTRPLRGGVGIRKGGLYGPECTAGFKAIGNTFGNRFILTAGHCVVLGGTYKWYAEVPNLAESPAIGLAEGTNYPGGDWTAINANGSYWDKSPWPSQVAFWEHGTEAQETPIEAESASYWGEYVCHSGFTTGGRCGPVVQVNVTAKVSAGLEYHLVKFGPTCADEGDSGGPVFAGHVALGILSAKVLPPQGCGSDYGLYMEITEVADSLGVTVGPRLGTIPYGETEEATNIQPTEATLTGYVNPHGIAATYAFEYGPTTAYGSTTGQWGAGSGWQTIAVSGTWANFEPAMLYHFRIRAQNSAGIGYGVDEEFTTPPAPPFATTEGVSGVAAGKAILHGTSNPRGSSTHYRFEWGTSTGYGNSVPIPDADIGSGRAGVPVTQAINVKGLTKYHYRLVASNVAGTTYGTDREFETPDWRPGVIAEEPTAVSGTGATLRASVNPKGFPSKYHFEYGPTLVYGTSAPVPDGDAGTGESDVPVNQTIGGLQAGTLYHVRIVATNSEGTTTAKALFETPMPTAICKVPGSSCAAGQRYPAGTLIQAKLKGTGKLKLSGPTISQECSESTISGKSTADTGVPLPLEVTALTVAGCSSGGCKTLEARNLPYLAGLASTGGSNGSLALKSGKGSTGIKATGCPFGATCTYGTPEIGLALEGSSTASLAASEVDLKFEEGSKFICGESIKLTATYEVTAPKPLYASEASETVLCKAFTSPCLSTDVYAEGTKLEAKLQGMLSVGLGNFGEQPCYGATIVASSKAGAGNPLAAEVETMKLTECQPCASVVVKGVPLKGSVRSTLKGDGRLSSGIQIEWSECPFGVRCVYGSAEAPLLELSGGNPPSAKAKGVQIPFLEGSTKYCGKYVELSGGFVLAAPASLWVARGKG